MSRARRLLLISALLATSFLGMPAPVTPVVADPPPLVNIAPKHCGGPGVVQSDAFCGAICPQLPCYFEVCARNCDLTVTCYYKCPVP